VSVKSPAPSVAAVGVLPAVAPSATSTYVVLTCVESTSTGTDGFVRASPVFVSIADQPTSCFPSASLPRFATVIVPPAFTLFVQMR
jgi:hypothetical protein